MRTLLLLLTACWTGSGTPAAPVESAFEITLERTPCFGMCPVYRVSIDGDGRVTWLGKQHVEAVGARRASVPPRRVRDLERKLTDVRFFERDADGNLARTPTCAGGACTFPSDTICSDTSASIITVRRERVQHTIRHDHCEPSPLDELVALVDDVARTTAWIGTRVVAPQP